MSSARRAPARGKAKGGKAELTEEQKQEIREAFDLFDTDGSGLQPRSQQRPRRRRQRRTRLSARRHD
jgi:Ca2+-binding EF-hand superfamily protein